MRAPAQTSHFRGFTLMEMMIVVAIIGILMSVALPAYRDSLNKGRRSDGMSLLLDATNRQERLMLDRSTYSVNMADLGFSSPFLSQEGYYNLSAVACASGTIATCYELTATPVSSSAQAKDAKCATLTLDSFGAKTATGTAPAECW